MRNGGARPGRRRALRRIVGGVGGAAALVGSPASLLAGWSSAARAERLVGPVRVRDLYDKDRSFSALTLSLDGERIDVTGYMAPPLKADSRFFVLTARPMTTCPFCSDVADWPDDIAAVYTKRRLESIAFNVDIVVRGRLELGKHTDADTGFVSLLRLEDAVFERR